MPLFSKSKKASSTALPQATRGTKSSDGPTGQSTLPPLNNSNGNLPRPEFRPRSPTSAGGPVQNGGATSGMTIKPVIDQSTPRASEDTDRPLRSMSSEPRMQPRERADSDLKTTPPSKLGNLMPSRPAPDPSPYPWSKRQLAYTVANVYPFPRYGPAVNSVASRDGTLYIMGGLINGATVKGDLWTIEAGQGGMACSPVATTSEGPGPRVGHASLLVGNAFIVFGGDTKTDESDFLDETLYLLNTSTKQWSRAAPAGFRPAGRYGHTLNILGSKIYVFGGQVEGFFFNDLVAFDLNALQQPGNQWEVMIQNTMEGGPPAGQSPPARTNHTIVSWNDHLYLFGGTDGITWFNDVWSYDPRTNSWTEMDSIGYIPSAREGHAAALVGDVMYIFGGRTEDGLDLGDLAAFRIPSRRWYTFQNMGPSPSPRSGHTMTALGKMIVVLAGEPSSAPRDANELSLAYFLDTTKIKYPPDANSQNGSPSLVDRGLGQRRPSVEQFNQPQPRAMTPKQLDVAPQRTAVNGVDQSSGPRPLYANGSPQPGQQPTRGMSPQMMQNGAATRAQRETERSSSPLVEAPIRAENIQRSPPTQFSNMSETAPAREVISDAVERSTASPSGPATNGDQQRGLVQKQSMEPVQQVADTRTRTPTQQKRWPSEDQNGTPRESLDRPSLDRPSADRPSLERPFQERSDSQMQRIESRQADTIVSQVDSGLGSSPSAINQRDILLKQLETERSQNSWLLAELALARKSGYTPSSPTTASGEPLTRSVGEDEKPLVEALLRTRAELMGMRSLMEERAQSMIAKIAQAEKQRDLAISEATFAKAKLAASGPEANGRSVDDAERSNDLSRRLALALAGHAEMTKTIDALKKEVQTEKQARLQAEENVATHQTRAADLHSAQQNSGRELESLRAELHEAQRVARDELAKSTEAVSAHKLIALDKAELESKLETANAAHEDHTTVLASLHEAVNASSDKAALLEQKLEEQQALNNTLQEKISELRSELEARTAELETSSRQLRDAEELAATHAKEAETHRTAVLEGFGKIRDNSDKLRGIHEERVTVLQQQIDTANGLVKSHQDAADTAANKLRSAEERIAGLEAFQEMSSREGLSLRKQVQSLTKDLQAATEENNKLQQQLQSQQLETNAMTVQHSALKDVLAERGINPAEIRRNRMVDSPTSLTRLGASTPDPARLRELEQQLEASGKTQDELRARLEEVEERDVATRREYEEKLTALDSDHQAAAKYLRGTEKMLSKMKSELQRVKQQSAEYLTELESLRAGSADGSRATPSDWESERTKLMQDIEAHKSSMATSLAPLESQISALQAEVRSREADLESLKTSHSTTQGDLHALRSDHESSQQDLEHLRQENAALASRAADAEAKVQLLLDQVESSVDNYRRQTINFGNGHTRLSSVSSIGTAQMLSEATPHGHTRQESLGSSQHSDIHDDQTLSANDRNSMAINSMMTELDGLRYRLSGKFDFERTPTKNAFESSKGLSEWRRGLEREDSDSVAGTPV